MLIATGLSLVLIVVQLAGIWSGGLKVGGVTLLLAVLLGVLTWGSLRPGIVVGRRA